MGAAGHEPEVKQHGCCKREAKATKRGNPKRENFIVFASGEEHETSDEKQSKDGEGQGKDEEW